MNNEKDQGFEEHEEDQGESLAAPPLGESDAALVSALHRYLSRKEEGTEASLQSFCEGDSNLERRLTKVLDFECAIARGLDALSVSAPIQNPTTVPNDDYEYVAPLGEGGMGRVILARQRSLNRFVALKILDRAFCVDPRVLERFRREAQVVASLEHSNIVPIYAYGEAHGLAYLTMKWLSGPDLAHSDGPWSPMDVARLGIRIAEALAHAHAAGILHRDVKPANIILDGETPYLTDFGLSRPMTAGGLTEPGQRPGTLAYMAPERLRNDVSKIDHRSDVYSLGASLYELLSGEPPFLETHLPALEGAILERPPGPLRLNAQDSDLETIVLACLEKDPEHRPPSAAFLSEELERFLRREPLRLRRSGPFRLLWNAARRRRRRIGILAGFALLLVATSSALWMHRSDSAERRREDEEAIRTAVDRKEVERSSELLSDYVRRFGSSTSESKDLVREVRGLEALEALLDEIQLSPADQSGTRLKQIVTQIEENNGERHDPKAAGIAKILALFQIGDLERAKARLLELETLGNPDGFHAAQESLRALLSGEWPRHSRRSDPRSATESFLVSLVMRQLQAPLSEQESELDRAHEMNPRDVRILLARCILRLAQRRFEEARIGLESLASVKPPPRLLGYFRARTLLELGEVLAAEAVLLSGRDLEPSPRVELLRARIALALSKRDEAQVCVNRALTAATTDASTLITASDLLEALGDGSRAASLLQKAASTATKAALVTEASVRLLESDLRRLETVRPSDSSLLHSKVEDLIQSAIDLEESEVTPEVKARALMIRVKCLALVPEDPKQTYDEMLGLCRRALRIHEDLPSANLTLILMLKPTLASQDAQKEVLQAVVRLTHLHRTGAFVPQDSEAWFDLVLQAIEIARRQDDHPLAQRILQRLKANPLGRRQSERLAELEALLSTP